MYEINTRIKELRLLLKLSQADFGHKLGLKHSAISDIENNKSIVTNRYIISICTIFHVNKEWLVSGKGDIFIKENKKYDEFFTIFNKLSTPLQEFLLKVGEELLNTQNKL